MAVFRTLVRHRTVKVVFLSEAKISSSDFTFIVNIISPFVVCTLAGITTFWLKTVSVVIYPARRLMYNLVCRLWSCLDLQLTKTRICTVYCLIRSAGIIIFMVFKWDIVRVSVQYCLKSIKLKHKIIRIADIITKFDTVAI